MLVWTPIAWRRPPPESTDHVHNTAQELRPSIFGVFLSITGLLAVLRAFVYLTGHVPMGHDTAQYLQLQYTFYNEFANGGALPYWLPFMTHGTVANTWLLISHGLFASPSYLFAHHIGTVNYLLFYHAGLFFDELVLLLGCVLLSRRLYHSTAPVFFVSSAIVFTSMSVTQVWWDFHLFYLIPLILYCADRALCEASARYLFLACLFIVSTLLGNLPYFLPMTLFTLTTFGLSFGAVMPIATFSTLRHFLRAFRARHVLALLGSGALGVALLYFLLLGSRDEVIYANVGRDASGRVISIEEFVSYGGYITIWKYTALLNRIGNNLDITIYRGLLVVPFALYALARVRSRASYAVGITTGIVALFSIATIVTVFFFYIFPLGNLFRHIGLSAPIVTMLLTFYAGFGFEDFWRRLRFASSPIAKRSSLANTALLVPPLAIFGIGALAILERTGFARIFDYNAWSLIPTRNQWLLESGSIDRALSVVLVLCAGYSALLILSCVVQGRPRSWPLAILLAVHLADVFSVKAEMELRRAPTVAAEVVALFNPLVYQYTPYRSQDYHGNDRFMALAPDMLETGLTSVRGDTPMSTIGAYGALYWNIESFIYMDTVAHIFRSDHWLRSIDAFHQAHGFVKGPDARHLGLPIPESVAYRKMVGSAEPKLQVFSRIHLLPDREDVSTFIGRPNYTGDAVLAASEEITVGDDSRIRVWRDGAPRPDLDDRLRDAVLSVEQFAFNRVRIRVSVPTEHGGILYYADAWHPDWQAWVNGSAVRPIRANLGYKAVPIPAGESTVEFRFGTPSYDALSTLMLITGILACVAVLGLLVQLGSGQALVTKRG